MLVVSRRLEIVESPNEVKVQDGRSGKPPDKNPASDKRLSLVFIFQPKDPTLVETGLFDSESGTALVIGRTDPT